MPISIHDKLASKSFCIVVIAIIRAVSNCGTALLMHTFTTLYLEAISHGLQVQNQEHVLC